jgi:anti-sigma regulatory factor (Ser/Thr protein kinase)
MKVVSERLTVSIPSHPRYLCALRGFFENLLNDLGFPREDVMQVTLAVHEACTNIIVHGYQGDTSQRIDLAVDVTPDVMTVEIRDYADKPNVAAIQPRALQDVRPGGLGTHLMRTIMDVVEYDLSVTTGTVLRMTKRRSMSCTSP